MFFSDDDLSLELLGVFKINRGTIKRKSFNNRSYDSLSIRLNGSCRFIFQKEKCDIKPNEILYLPMKEKYTQETDGETVIAIHFINSSYNSKNKFEVNSLENIPEAESIILEMYKTWNEKRKGYKYMCSSLFYKLIYLVNTNCYSNSTYETNIESTIKKAVDYIHKNFRKDTILISDLANKCAVSETYFRKIFKELYSFSPSQYIINLRLEYAAQLLQSHLYSVLEVSQKSGFSDVKYFSRIFKKHYGITPSEYKIIDIEKNLS